MGLPGALRNLHIRKHGRKRGFLRGAGVDAEADLVDGGVHMADAHLAEVDSIGGALDAKVVLPAGKAVPHRLYIGRYGRSGPVGITVVGGHTSKVLELLILELDGTLKPVVAVQVHHYAALVEALMALCEVRLHHEAEELLPGLHLKHRGIIVPEMVVCPLPKVRVRGRSNGDDTVLHFTGSRLSGPLELVQIDLSTTCESLGYAVGKFSVRRFL